MILGNSAVSNSDLVLINDRYYHWDFHGDFSGVGIDETSQLLTTKINHAHKFIQEADAIFFTLGTANVFKLIDNNHIVANCHKYPNEKFNRIALKVDEIIGQFQNTIESLSLLNPNLKVVFTVSPVRHLRDGLVNNQLSKAKLLHAVHQLCEANEHVYYFPSYELVMDDLRDYRFYSNDMIHLNETGLDYIWDFFKQSFFTNDTTSKIESINKINKEIAHKPFYPDSDQHQKFLLNLLTKIKRLENTDSHLNYSKEKMLIMKQIKN